MNNWVSGVDFPSWMQDSALKTLDKGYLLPGESPKDMWRRISKAAASRLNKPELEDKFFDLFWKGWLGAATPVLCNMGTDRGLNISCYGLSVDDSISGIFNSVKEMAMLSKSGGGVGIYLGNVRGRGTAVSGNGTSEGIIPWAKCFDVATVAVSQGSSRRGASVIYLPIEHLDIEEFLRIRRAQGDINRQCLNIHQAVTITDEFMRKVESGDSKARKLLTEVYAARLELGEPYIMHVDTVNKANPQAYINNNLTVSMSNLCSEIALYSDNLHTFVCCLSSLNLAKWEEWKNTDAIYLSTMFLDAVMEEFIAKASTKPELENAVRFAKKSRALGLGVMGYHTLLQSEGTEFNSFRAKLLNRAIFDKINSESLRASQDLAKEYGEPEWCVGTGTRHTHRLAIAPTLSNSLITGNISAGIEPIIANAFVRKTAKGTFIEKNLTLMGVLDKLGKNTQEVWDSISANAGSVQQLDFLSQEQKAVFKTAFEIDQMSIIEQAGERQKYIDQAQSLNLFFPANVDPKYFHKVHYQAWKLGVKTLYYCRSTSVLKGDVASREVIESAKEKTPDECKACEG